MNLQEPAEIASIRGDVDALEQILSTDATLINYTSPEGESLLYFAAKNGRVAMVEYILSNGGELLINKTQKDGKSPLWAAIYKSKCLPVVKLLLLHGAAYKNVGEFSPIDCLGSEDGSFSAGQDFLWSLTKWLLGTEAQVAENPSHHGRIDRGTLNDWLQAITKIGKACIPTKADEDDFDSDVEYWSNLRKEKELSEVIKAKAYFDENLFDFVYGIIDDGTAAKLLLHRYIDTQQCKKRYLSSAGDVEGLNSRLLKRRKLNH